VLAVVASVLTVNAVTGPYDVSGDRIDMKVDELAAMKRPGEAKGVKLDDPGKEKKSEGRALLPLEAKEKCEKSEIAVPELGIKKGQELCGKTATRQSKDALDRPRFKVAKGSKATRIPDVVELPEPEPTATEPTPGEGDETPAPDDEGGDDDGEVPLPSPTASSPSPGNAAPAYAPASSTGFTPAVFPQVEPSGDGTTFLSPNWVESSSTGGPAAGYGHEMAYDPVREQIVMFGGAETYTGARLDETWTWSNGVWTQLSPAHAPSPRATPMMAWDPVRQAIVLFGGNIPGGTFYNDTWTWDGTDWTKLTMSGSVPSTRSWGAFAYDPVRDGLVLFGGYAPAGARLNDTWFLASGSSSWTQIQANGVSGAPSIREGAGLAYSESTSQLVLFGGASSGTGRLNDTWVLPSTGSSWTQQHPDHSPPARMGLVMAFDPGIDGIVMFGGADASATVLNDTWAWTGDDWLVADGIAAPPGLYSAAGTATPSGQLVVFGGATVSNGSTTTDKTWVYDAGLPLLDIEVTKDGDAPSDDLDYFYVGESAKIRITAKNAGVEPIESENGTTITSALTDTLLAAGSQVLFGTSDAPVVIDPCSGVVDDLCGGVADLVTTIANIEIPALGTRVADFVATVAGTQRGCELIDVPAMASSIFGGSEVVTNLTVCGGGLGIEDWWTYDTTDLGNGGVASVNVANGNLVVKQDDFTPVQTPGRLAMSLSRVYNSQDLMSGGGPLGAGWQWDIGDTGEFAGGFGLAGFSLPNLQNVLQPLSMPYIDRDGTRHVFKLRSITAAVPGLSLPIDLSDGLSSVTGIIKELLNSGSLPFDLTPDPEHPIGYTNLCIDQAYTGPPGSDMFLFRYIGVGSANACANPASASGVMVGWSLLRPDRVRYDFDILGNLLAVTDPAGQQLLYDYDPGESHGPVKITTASCGNGEDCPSIDIKYDAGGAGSNRRVEVTDAARRVTSYIVTRSAVPQLIEVWEPGNPYSTATGAKPTEAYTYSTASTPCPGSVSGASTIGQLCSITDAAGAVTKVTYEKAPKGPDRVKTVTDRRGTVTADGATKGLATAYTWDDTADFVTADMAAPSTLGSCSGNSACQRVRYSDIDDAGRVGQIAEGSANNAFLRQTGYFWDGGAIASCSQPIGQVNNNLCQTITRAVPSNDPFVPGEVGTATQNGVTVHDQATDYTYGQLGQVLRQRVLLDADDDWTDANSAITTWGTRDQYFDADGVQRAFDNRVEGQGEIASSGSSTNYRKAVLDDNPVAYWQFSESSGTTMKSETGTNNGTYASGVTLGRSGAMAGDPALGEKTTGASATVTSLSGFAHGTTATDSDFTVEGWMKTSSTAAETTVQWGNSGTQYASVGRLAGGLPSVFLASDTATSKGLIVYSTTSVADGAWHHVAYTYDGSGDAAGVKIYVDGVLAPKVTYLDTLDGEFAASSPLALLGGAAAESDLDDLALYPRVLSDAELGVHRERAYGGIRVEADTLYGVTDQIQELSPRGNSTSNWGDYLTAFRRDIPADGTVASTNKPAAGTICGSAERGNTGVLCESDTPASAGVAAGDCVSPTSKLPAGSPSAPTSSGYTHTCTTFTYDDAGQRITMKTPKAHETGSNKQYEYTYYDKVTSCAGANAEKCDLSGTVAADGWLKAVSDPDGNFVAYAYDAAGNIARTWDRNATEGKDLTDDWADANAPPSREFTDTVSATPVTSDALSVSNTALITVQPDGTVMGNGTNGSGELGDGTTNPHSTPVPAKLVNNVVQVAQSSTGALAGCAITVYRLGNGDVWFTGNTQTTPAKVAGVEDIINVAVGGCHVLALDAKGQLWAWGINSTGQVGNGSNATVYTPVKVLDDVATIGAGYTHSLAVKTDGTLWTWGNNASGQLGLGDTSNRNTPTQVESIGVVSQVSGGVSSSYAIRHNGRVFSWGANAQGELGHGDTTQRTAPAQIAGLGSGTSGGPVRQVVGAAYGAAALMGDGTVRAWGVNNVGQLGGATSDPNSMTPVQIPGVDHQVAIAGGFGTWATADQAGKITVWGSTSNHQIGKGTAPTSSPPTTAGQNISPYRLPWRYTRGTRDATGNLSTVAVDKVGNLRSTRTGRGNEIFSSMFDTYADYDTAQRQVWSISAANRDGAKIASTEYDVFGNPIKSIDPVGNATRASFDKVNRQTGSAFTRDADEAPSTCLGSASSSDYTPGQAGDKICIGIVLRDGADRPVVSFDANSQLTSIWSDAAGRVVRQDAPRNDGTYTTLTSRWRYDKDGNVLTACSPRQFDSAHESNTTSSCSGGGVHSTDLTWDRAGRLAKQQQYRAGSSTTTLTTSISYDADGNQISATDANGHTTTAAFDLQARRTSMTKPRTGSISYTTRWSYDPAGNVTAVRAPGSLNIGSGADGHLVVDGTTGSNSTDGVAHGSGNPFQIPDGAQYRSVTLQNGAHVTAADDHGLMFHATETVTVCATCVIDMAGQGYAGGAGGTSLLGGQGGDAENPNTGETPGNGGTGGGGNLLAAGSGGGGGGHKNAGGDGAVSNPGIGGLKSGTSDFTDVGTSYLRGAGGGGGGGGRGLLGNSGDGGDGGGYVRITATKIIIDGQIDASGQTGANATSGSGGGGGGAGGGIWLAAPTINLASATTSLNVSGGAGGTAPNDRNGGNGSVGYIRIDADTLTNEPAGVDRSKAAMITAYSYDAANRVIDTIEGAQTLKADPAADHGEFAVPDPHGLANTRTRTYYNADGQVSVLLPPQAFSNAASLTAPNLATARRIDYDLDGRQKTVYTPRYDTSVTSIGAGDDGNTGTDQQTAQCTTGRTPDGVDEIGGYPSGTGVCVTRTTYDANGNVYIQWMPSSVGGDNRYLSYLYTPDNLPRLVRAPDPNGSGRVEVARTRYDGVGQAIEVEDANGNKTLASYTGDRLPLTRAAQSYSVDSTTITHVEQFTFDANGNARTFTDPKGNVTTNTWTSDNLLAASKAPGANGSTFNTTRYTYDKVGNPVTVLSPQQEADGSKALVNEYTHDNLLAATHTPVTTGSYRSVDYAHAPSGAKIATETARCASGTVANCTPGSTDWHTAGVMRLTYGANGRVADQVGKDHSSITTTYAQHGGPKTVSDPISDITIAAGYYLDGLPRTVNDGSNENAYAFDGLGQVSVRSDKTGSSGVTGGDTITTSYAYNDAGLVVHMDSGVLDQVTDYSWDDAGRLTKEQTGGHTNDWSWHPDDSVAGMKTTAGGSTKADFQYRYDNNGDITRQTVTGAEAYTNTYSYTPARNLASWTHTPGGGSAATTTYGWDRNNNRLSATSSAGTTSWSYRLDNSISAVNAPGTASDFSFSYDDAGRLTSDGCNTNTYDDFDRVLKVVTSGSTACGGDSRTTEYTYDGLDRQRTIKVSGASPSSANATTSSVYDGLATTLVGQINAVNGADSTPNVLYQLDSDGSPIGLEQSGAGAGKSFLDTDGQGNVSTEVTTGNAVACAIVYDPFGSPITPASGSEVCKSGSKSGTTGNAAGYRGNPRDGSTGNYQLGTRTYDPSTAAFTTPDSYRLGGADTDMSVGVDPLTANTYTYVNGNPINWGDPTGHRVDCGAQNCNGQVTPDGRPLSKSQLNVQIKLMQESIDQGSRNLAAEQARHQSTLAKSWSWVEAAAKFGFELTSVADLKHCVKGSITSCGMFGLSWIGGIVGKGAKAFDAIKDIRKAYKTFNRSQKAAEKALAGLSRVADNIRASKQKLSQLVEASKRATDTAVTTTKKVTTKVTSSAKNTIQKVRGKTGNVAVNSVRSPEELASIASRIKNAPDVHSAQLSHQVIAVGTDADGILVAASNTSSSFTRGQRAIMDELGVTRAPSRTVAGDMLHAEENLLGVMPNPTGIGTSALKPCPGRCSPMLSRFGIPWATAP